MTQEEYRSEITLSERGKEVIRVDEEGFHYNGQFIADAGEAHRLLVEFLGQGTKSNPNPQGLTVQDYAKMEKHSQSFIAESGGLLTLDGCFTREELLELANALPAN
jgi:hypothetical protein